MALSYRGTKIIRLGRVATVRERVIHLLNDMKDVREEFKKENGTGGAYTQGIIFAFEKALSIIDQEFPEFTVNEIAAAEPNILGICKMCLEAAQINELSQCESCAADERKGEN